MSDVETHIGKLRKVQIDMPLEKWCEQKCKEKEILEISSYNNTWVEEFRGATDDFFVVEGEVYESIEHKELDETDICEMIPNPDGSITFVMQFYNGGTCLSECIEYAIKKMKSEK